MYCPKCAAQNVADSKFCRVCGTNLALVTQALANNPPALPNEHTLLKKFPGTPNLSRGINKFFSGISFLAVAVILWFFMRQEWAVWLLIPAFTLLGKGVSELVTIYLQPKLLVQPNLAAQPVQMPTYRAPRTGELTPKVAPELESPRIMMPPPSVTEETTRNLNPAINRAREEQVHNPNRWME